VKHSKNIALIGLITLTITGALILFLFRPGAGMSRVERAEKMAGEAIAAGNFLDAEVVLRKALERSPKDPRLLFKLGVVLEKQGVLDQAKESFAAAAAAGNDPEAGYNAGMTALKLNRQDEAESYLQENNRSFPSHVPTLYQLGTILAKTGRYDEALPYFRKIVELEPNEAEAYNNLGFCYYSLGQLEKARDMFNKALELKPDFESARRSLETVEDDLSGKPLSGSTEEKCADCK